MGEFFMRGFYCACLFCKNNRRDDRSIDVYGFDCLQGFYGSVGKEKNRIVFYRIFLLISIYDLSS